MTVAVSVAAGRTSATRERGGAPRVGVPPREEATMNPKTILAVALCLAAGSACANARALPAQAAFDAAAQIPASQLQAARTRLAARVEADETDDEADRRQVIRRGVRPRARSGA